MKRVWLLTPMDVPDDTDPARVLEVFNGELYSATDGGGLCQWGDWHPGDAVLTDDRVAARGGPEALPSWLEALSGRFFVVVTYADGRSAELLPEIAANGGWQLEAPDGAVTVAGMNVRPGDTVRGTISLA